MIPLQIPGGPELLIISIIFLLFIALVGVVFVGIVFLVRRRSTGGSPDEQRLAELERRVDALESKYESGNESYRTGQREDE